MIFIILIFVLICSAIFIVMDMKNTEQIKEKRKEHELKLKERGYVKPQFVELTQEEIDDIHSRGRITPAEKVKEWEDMDLCTPGDAIGSAAWRCKKFDNCHDCLVDYAGEHGEYVSFYDILKINNK